MSRYIFEQLPKSLIETSISLHDLLGVNNYAWLYEDALRLANWCGQNEVAIVGGDVIEQLETNRLSYTYNNWFINTDANLTRQEFVSKSVDYAIQRVDFYTKNYKHKILLFQFVFG